MCWTKSENVVWEELDGGALLIDTKSGSRWTLSATASAAWKLCDGKRTLAEMAEALRQSRESIAGFCEQLAALGLLTTSPRLQPALINGATYRTGAASPFKFEPAGLGAGPRRRPSPRGNSGPG